MVARSGLKLNQIMKTIKEINRLTLLARMSGQDYLVVFVDQMPVVD
jgi:hypothetical protein